MARIEPSSFQNFNLTNTVKMLADLFNYLDPLSITWLLVIALLLKFAEYSKKSFSIIYIALQILPANIKGLAGSIATLSNWFIAWVVTMTANLLLEWSSGGTFLSLTHTCTPNPSILTRIHKHSTSQPNLTIKPTTQSSSNQSQIDSNLKWSESQTTKTRNDQNPNWLHSD